MIKKWYEISCDECGSVEYLKGTQKIVEETAIDIGWIKKGQKHFCCEKCLKTRNDIKFS
jgi:hypothetical protein